MVSAGTAREGQGSLPPGLTHPELSRETVTQPLSCPPVPLPGQLIGGVTSPPGPPGTAVSPDLGCVTCSVTLSTPAAH